VGATLKPEIKPVDCSRLDYEQFLGPTYWCQSPYGETATKAIEKGLEVLERILHFWQRTRHETIARALPIREQVYAQAARGENFDTRYPQITSRNSRRSTTCPISTCCPCCGPPTTAKPQQFYALKDVHFNDTGHRVTGEELARFFNARGSTGGLLAASRRSKGTALVSC